MYYIFVYTYSTYLIKRYILCACSIHVLQTDVVHPVYVKRVTIDQKRYTIPDIISGVVNMVRVHYSTHPTKHITLPVYTTCTTYVILVYRHAMCITNAIITYLMIYRHLLQAYVLLYAYNVVFLFVVYTVILCMQERYYTLLLLTQLQLHDTGVYVSSVYTTLSRTRTFPVCIGRYS